MSSALDDDTQRALAEGQETARAVLRSAQKDLQKVFVVFLIGFLGTFYALRLYVWEFLRGITAARMPPEIEAELEIIAQTPFEVILLQAKIGMVVGLIAAAPALLYFGRDALRDRGLWPSSPVAPWKLAVLAGTATLLFGGGVAYGYLVFFPIMFNFLAGFGLEAGFSPSYSIVMWTEFIVFLSLSFGLAGQMPLLVSGLSYAEVVPYETFRDKWRYAVVAIFAFGALFSPPDPFTQIMWAVPLLVLYAFSLYLAKVVVTARRGSDRIDLRATARANWNRIAGLGAASGAAVYLFYAYGGRAAFNDALARIGSSRRVLPAGEGLGMSPEAAVAVYGLIAGLLAAVVALLYFVYADLDATAGGRYGDPTAIDIGELDAAGVRAAPREAFEALEKEEAVALAGAATEAGDAEKARAILDRYDAAGGDGSGADGSGAAGADDGGQAGGVADRVSRASSTFLDELADDEDGDDAADDIGGYYTDAKFVFDSVRSRSFRIVLTFLLVMGGTFFWLYLGGLRDVREDFLGRLPAAIAAGDVEFRIITLHPVEALIFMVKFSVLVGALAALPMVAYHAWPALRDRGFVRGRARQVYVWTGALAGGLLGGFALGYFYIAPGIISYLVADALRAEMIITYRINDFFWLIVFTTIGIGLLADVPILMVLLNAAGVPYGALRGRWREVTIAFLTFAAVLTPADIITMFLVTVPLMAAYGVGLGLLFVVTLGGRRNLAPPAEIVETELRSYTGD